MRSLVTLAPLLGVAALGCGARSSLALGAGGAASSTSASGSGGGTGGLVCTRRDAIVIDAAAEVDHDDPVLTLASDDGAEVTVLFGAPLPPAALPRQLQHVSFAAWGAWPPPVGSVLPLSAAGGGSFAAAQHPGDLFAALYDEAPAGMTLAPAISVGESGAAGAILVDAQASVARFLTGGARHLAGYQRRDGGPGPVPVYRLDAAASTGDAQGTTLGPPVHLGCATGEMAADARPSGDGWIVALTSGTALGDPACVDGSAPAPTSQIQLARVDAAGGLTAGATLGALGAPDLVRSWVKLAPRPDGGAFLVWHEPGNPPDLRAALVDPAGQLVGSGFSVSAGVLEETEVPVEAWFAPDRLGDRLAVAWLAEFDVGADIAPQIVVEVLDPGGQRRVVDRPPAGFVSSPLALLASPSGTSFLVAWASQDTNGLPPMRVHVMRYDCAPG